MSRTVAYYNLYGKSLAKTDRAIFFLEEGSEKAQWFPLSVAEVKFIGADFKVKLSVPDWHLRRIGHSAVKIASYFS